MNAPPIILRITIHGWGDGAGRWPVDAEWTGRDQKLRRYQGGSLALAKEQLDELGPHCNQPQPYGALLYRALFSGAVGEALASARGEGSGVRLLLSVEPPELQQLRWERLYIERADGAHGFLARDATTPFSYLLSTSSSESFPPLERDRLRALVLVASPKDLATPDYNLNPFDATAMAQVALSGLHPVEAGLLAHLPADAPSELRNALVGPPTLGGLVAALQYRPAYQLLHIVCHGRYAASIGTRLFLANDAGLTEPVDDEALIGRLRSLGKRPPHFVNRLPHFVFLSACESGAPEFGGLAQRLVRELGIPAVLAMTERIRVATARELAHHFYAALYQHGEVDTALVEAFGQVPALSDVTVPAVFSRLGGLSLLRSHDGGLLSQAELMRFGPILRPLIAIRAPILVDEVRALVERLGQGPATEEQRGIEAELDRICSLVFRQGLSPYGLRKLLADEDPGDYAVRQPFMGLHAFDSDNQKYFFGRESVVAELRERLRGEPFLAILGSSGSGKSSLARAGLIPSLIGSHSRLPTQTIKPGDRPKATLEAALGQLAPTRTGPRPILLIDQFEELFTLCPSEAERREVIERLVALAEAGRHTIILTMRTDFLVKCAPYRPLAALIERHPRLLAPLSTEELRSAIERQAHAGGLSFEADLLSTLIEEVRGEPGAMPLLQQALFELFDRRYGELLSTREYRILGGVRETIAQRAGELYSPLDRDDKRRMSLIWQSLTRLDDDERSGETRRDTRRRARLSELVAAGDDVAMVEALVKRFVDARLFVSDHNEQLGEPEVEFAHEALIDHWRDLREWLNEGRAELRFLARLRTEAGDWVQAGRSPELLYLRGEPLRKAEHILGGTRRQVTADVSDYIAACRERYKGDEQQRRRDELEHWIEARRQERLPRLEYSIRANDDGSYSGYAVFAEQGTGGAAVLEELALPLDLVRMHAAPDQTALATALGEALFADERFRELWRAALGQASAERPLQLRLRFPVAERRQGQRFGGLDSQAASALALRRSRAEQSRRFPWELARDPESGAPLWTCPNLVIARYEQVDEAPRQALPLQALRAFTASAPSLAGHDFGRPPLAARRELEELRGLFAAEQIAAAVLDGDQGQSTADELFSGLDRGPQVALLYCHISAGLDDDAMLLFGGSHSLRTSLLAQRLARSRRKPRLIVIREPGHAPAGERAEVHAIVGERLLRAGAWAVLMIGGGAAGDPPLAPLLHELFAHGHLGRALARFTAGARAQPDWPQVSLFTSLEEPRLWLVPPAELQQVSVALASREGASPPLPLVVTLQRTREQGVDACAAEAELQLEPDGPWIKPFGARPLLFEFDPRPALAPGQPVDVKGAQLSAAVFEHPWLLAAYRTAQTLAAARGRSVLLQVRMSQADLLMHALPWELLSDPLDAVRAGVGEQMILTRALMKEYGPLVNGQPLWRAPGRGLIVAPPPPEGVVIDAEVSAIAQSFVGWDIEILAPRAGGQPATLEKVRAALAAGPTFVYLLCVARYDRAGEHQIMLQGDGGEAAWSPITELLPLFRKAQPRLVVLFTQTPDGGLTTANPAQQLAMTGVPAVVGIDLKTPYRLVTRFTTRLFAELAEHGTVELAVATARATLFELLDSDLSSVPVPLLYLQSLVPTPLARRFAPADAAREPSAPSVPLPALPEAAVPPPSGLEVLVPKGALVEPAPVVVGPPTAGERGPGGVNPPGAPLLHRFPVLLGDPDDPQNEPLLVNGIDAETGLPLLRIDAVTASRLAQGKAGSEPKERIDLYKARRTASSVGHL